jgi:hypothetical protein
MLMQFNSKLIIYVLIELKFAIHLIKDQFIILGIFQELVKFVFAFFKLLIQFPNIFLCFDNILEL